MTRPGSRDLSQTQQAFSLRTCFPDARTTVSKDRLVWRGRIQPTAASRVYEVEIVYTGRKYPRVRVLAPTLEPNSEGVLPHYFREGALCLHERHEWHSDMRIVDTIIPWTSEWLAYYELWLATGLWFGDGDDAGRELHGVDAVGPPLPRALRRRSARYPRAPLEVPERPRRR